MIGCWCILMAENMTTQQKHKTKIFVQTNESNSTLRYTVTTTVQYYGPIASCLCCHKIDHYSVILLNNGRRLSPKKLFLGLISVVYGRETSSRIFFSFDVSSVGDATDECFYWSTVSNGTCNSTNQPPTRHKCHCSCAGYQRKQCDTQGFFFQHSSHGSLRPDATQSPRICTRQGLSLFLYSTTILPLSSSLEMVATPHHHLLSRGPISFVQQFVSPFIFSNS